MTSRMRTRAGRAIRSTWGSCGGCVCCSISSSTGIKIGIGIAAGVAGEVLLHLLAYVLGRVGILPRRFDFSMGTGMDMDTAERDYNQRQTDRG